MNQTFAGRLAWSFGLLCLLAAGMSLAGRVCVDARGGE